jgi:hypothetical protein
MFFQNRAVDEITWKNMAQPDGPQMTIKRLQFACWINKATDTGSEYVIIAFLRHQWLCQRASMLPLYGYWLSRFLSSCEPNIGLCRTHKIIYSSFMIYNPIFLFHILSDFYLKLRKVGIVFSRRMPTNLINAVPLVDKHVTFIVS